MAMLTELCDKLEAVEEVRVLVHDKFEQRPGWFLWPGAAKQVQAVLEARGKVVQVDVEEWEGESEGLDS